MPKFWPGHSAPLSASIVARADAIIKKRGNKIPTSPGVPLLTTSNAQKEIDRLTPRKAVMIQNGNGEGRLLRQNSPKKLFQASGNSTDAEYAEDPEGFL